jgi:hypothetical protein
MATPVRAWGNDLKMILSTEGATLCPPFGPWLS